MSTRLFGAVFLKDSGKILHILESKSLEKMETMINLEEDVILLPNQIDISKYKIDIESRTLVEIPRKEIDTTNITSPEERDKRDKKVKENLSFPLGQRIDAIIRCLQLTDMKNPSTKDILELEQLKEALFNTLN